MKSDNKKNFVKKHNNHIKNIKQITASSNKCAKEHKFMIMFVKSKIVKDKI
jgi:hypothetical protein